MIKQMAADIASLQTAMRALSSITIEGYERKTNSGGITFGRASERGQQFTPPSRTVALIQRPETGARTLIVREVGYAARPPEPCATTGDPPTCDYAWYGDDFEAYPPLGMRTSDYQGFETSGTANKPPFDVKFLECRWQRGVWIVDGPAKAAVSMRFGLVTAATNSLTVYSVTIQPMKLTGITAPPESKPVFGADGAAGPRLCWPGSAAADFVGHVSAVGSSAAAYVLLVTLGSTEYVFPTYVFYNAQPTTTVPRGDCVVQ